MKTVFEIPVDFDENHVLKTEGDSPRVKAEIEQSNLTDPYEVQKLDQKKCLWYDYDQDKPDTSDSTGQKTKKGIRDESHDDPKSETLNSVNLDIDQDAIPSASTKSMTAFNTEQNNITESYDEKSSNLKRNDSAPPKLSKYIRSKPSMQRDPSLAWDGFVKEYDNEYDDSDYFTEHDVSSLPFDSIREYSMEEENPLNDIPEPYQDETPNETDFLGTPLSSSNRSVSKEFLQITPDLDGMSSDEGEEEIEYEKLLDPDYKEFMEYWEGKRKPLQTRTFDEVVKVKPLSTRNREYEVSLPDNDPPIHLTNLSVDEVVMTDEKPGKKPKHIKRPKKVKEFRIRPEKYSYTTHISDAFAWFFKDESSEKTLKATDKNSKSLDLNEFDIINTNDKDNVTPNVSFRDLPVDTIKNESTLDNKNETLEKASDVVNSSTKLESHDNSMNSSIVATEAEPSESEHVITNLIYSRTRRKKFKQKTEDYTIISIDQGTEPIDNKTVTKKSPDRERKITSPDSEKNVDLKAKLSASKSAGKEIKKVDITNESSDDDMLLFPSPYKGSRKGKFQTKKRSDSNELSLVNSFNTTFKEKKKDNDLNIDSTKDLRECNLTKDQNKPKESIDNKDQESLTKRSTSIKLDLTTKESADILNNLSQKESKVLGEPTDLLVENDVQRNENKVSNNADIENNVQIPHKTPNPTEITKNTSISSSKMEAKNGHGPNNPPDMLPDVSSFVVVQLNKPEDKTIIKNLNGEKPKASTEIQQTDSKAWDVVTDPLKVKNDPNVATNENNANKTAELDNNIQLPAMTTEEIEMNVSTNKTLSKTEVTNDNVNDNTSEIIENKNIASSKIEIRNGQVPSNPPDMLPDVSSFVVVQLDKPEGKTTTENSGEEKPETSEIQKTNSKSCEVAADLLQVKDDPDVAVNEDNVNNTAELDSNIQLPAVTTEEIEMNVNTKNTLSKTEATSYNVNDNTSVTLPNVSSYVVIKSQTHGDKVTIKALDKEKSGPKESEVDEPTDKNDIKPQENDCIPNAQNALGQINNNENSKESSISKVPETKKSNQVIPSPNVSIGISQNINDPIDKPSICLITDQQDVNQNQQNENRTNEYEDNSENEDKDSGKVIPVNTDLLKPTIMTPLIRLRIFFGYIYLSSINNNSSS